MKTYTTTELLEMMNKLFLGSDADKRSVLFLFGGEVIGDLSDLKPYDFRKSKSFPDRLEHIRIPISNNGVEVIDTIPMIEDGVIIRINKINDEVIVRELLRGDDQYRIIEKLKI